MASKIMHLFLAHLGIALLLSQYAAAFPQSPMREPWQARSAEKRADEGNVYTLGVGKADITGPVVELNLMGYADLSQTGTGLRQRLYSRAFIVGSPDDPDDRIVYLVLDTCSGDTAIRRGILEGLAALGSDYAAYTADTVAVTGTHSHAGPAGWHNYLLPQLTALGLNKQSYQAIVDGAVLSVKRAHESLAPGRLRVNSIRVDDANLNRSPWAYLHNPESERDLYTDDVDKNLTMLTFTRESDDKTTGVLTWFAVHGTSLYENNTLVAGDNKGVSAYLLEQAVQGTDGATDDFVAGFSQAAVADTTPNVEGAWCEDGSGEMCTFEQSLCNGASENCHGRGPYWGLDDGGTKSCWEIGSRVYKKAFSLYQQMQGQGDGTPVTGKTVKGYHSFHNMSGFSFTLANGSTVKTCSAALGYGFAAGTTDGPGYFDFKQGGSDDPDASPLWSIVSGFLHAPSDEQVQCQAPKPILLDVGDVTLPYAWAANIVDVQMLRVGSLFIIVSSGELSTMSGRRWRKSIRDQVESLGGLGDGADPIVVAGGPANSYVHYVTTPEEYSAQRYEGGSTLHGPHTVQAYINLTSTYLPYLLQKDGAQKPPVGPSPPDNRNDSLSLVPGVVYDNPTTGSTFGAVSTDVTASTFKVGDTINATFVGANPRNNLRLEDTYTAVEKLDGSDWVQVRSDEDWDLVLEWKRVDEVLGTSNVTISWETGWEGGKAIDTGTYRIVYYGDAKAPLIGTISNFTGHSSSFEIRSG